MKFNLGTGRLTWDGKERRSDRYGTVWLMEDIETSTSLSSVRSSSIVEHIPELVALYGELIATVKATRDSTHVGDLFRDISPETPEVGEVITLGEGRVFYEPCVNDGVMIGLEPLKDQSSDWLDPYKLYRCHEQTVQLAFVSKEIPR